MTIAISVIVAVVAFVAGVFVGRRHAAEITAVAAEAEHAAGKLKGL